MKGGFRMTGSTGGQARLLYDEQRTVYAVLDPTGQLHRGTVVIKTIGGSKRFPDRPIGQYRYVAYKQDGKTRWLYAGKIEGGMQCQSKKENSSKPRS
jgi:hypothetical protein